MYQKKWLNTDSALLNELVDMVWRSVIITKMQVLPAVSVDTGRCVI